MSTPTETDHIPANTLKGLSYARWAGRLMGVLLLAWGLLALRFDCGTYVDWIKFNYFVLLGVLLMRDYQNIAEHRWLRHYIPLVVVSIGFVFLMIVSVMFAYMELAGQGQKLGVPGLEGSLIFIALMQVPVVLFQRKPDLLD